MSLKAKLEAVIYAAEEPVTLAQLAALFASEALEWKAEREAVSQEEAAKAAGGEPMPLLNAEFAYFEADSEAAALESTGETSIELVLGSEIATQPEVEAGAEAQDEALADGAESGTSGERDELGVEVSQVSESRPGAPGEDGAPAEIEAGGELEPVPDVEPGAEENTDLSAEPVAEGATDATPQTPADAEAEAKRQARLRDREIRAILRGLLDELIVAYANDGRGIEIREIAGGYRMATKPECHDAVRSFVKSLKPALKLSLPALETLAVIAYKQPVTAPEVNEIRGVDSSGVFGSLLARKLIATAGRKQVIGRPILYKTTKEFLLRFGLKDVAELPSMEEFEKMAAIELEEPETAPDGQSATGPGEHSAPDSGVEFDENAVEESMEETGPGAAPEPAGTPAVQESPVAEMPAPTPVVTTAQNHADTPAERAAETSAAPDMPVEPEAPAALPESQSPADEPAAIEPANEAESTPA